MASQGPLDGRVSVVGGRATLNREVLERVIPSGITYSWELQLRWRIRRPHGADVDGTQAPGCRRRSPLTVHLKPYWGKPTVRNFRGGRGNPKLDRARRAPLPYSAVHHSCPKRWRGKSGVSSSFWGKSGGKSGVLQPIMPLDLPVKVRPWELTVYPRSHIRR